MKTLLIFCGYGRRWREEEKKKLSRLGEKYDLLLTETPFNSVGWERYSLTFLRDLKSLGPLPYFYVASWGTESKSWVNYLLRHSNFKGLYWNGEFENPLKPPPEKDYYGAEWKLWIPYTAGTRIGEIFEYINECNFPNECISVQPNVYQPRHRRTFIDLYRIYRLARKYNLHLEFEYDENMHRKLFYYRVLNWYDPDIFNCIYGGEKQILKVEDIL
ncbi:hypothetical protein DRH14_01845 [Candidatus Shapirobacteria bacterium]|nr:MAG: hypothetical protein DRH14_01845 [Candidatus Shapirobacteria bacterium]